MTETYRETVDNVTELSPLWSRFANSHKSEQHTILTQEFNKVCMSRGLSTKYYAPVVTTLLKQMVVGFQFVGHGPDDLSSGCQPFIVTYSGKDDHYRAVAAADVSNQLSHGEQAATLADYREIRAKEKVKFPKDVMDASITVCRFAVLCQVLFQGTGPTHPLVEAMWTTALGLQNQAPAITAQYQALSRNPGIAPTYYARVIRAIQLGVHDYFQQVAINVVESVMGVEVPNFGSMLLELKRGTFHQSTNWISIPDEYLGSAAPRTRSAPPGAPAAPRPPRCRVLRWGRACPQSLRTRPARVWPELLTRRPTANSVRWHCVPVVHEPSSEHIALHPTTQGTNSVWHGGHVAGATPIVGGATLTSPSGPLTNGPVSWLMSASTWLSPLDGQARERLLHSTSRSDRLPGHPIPQQRQDDTPRSERRSRRPATNVKHWK